MLTGNGVKPEKAADGSVKPIHVGPNRVLYAPPNADGSVGNWRYIEPSSNSLEFGILKRLFPISENWGGNRLRHHPAT